MASAMETIPDGASEFVCTESSAGGALVDGKMWPLVTGEAVLLPSGAHTIEAAPKRESIFAMVAASN